MSENIVQFKKVSNPPISDEILIYATRMFLPDVPNLDLNGMVRRALSDLRNIDRRGKVSGVERKRALWQAGDPLYIAHYTMMFVKPQLAGDEKYHDWHGRLIRLRREREEKLFPKSERCEQ